MNSRQNWLKLNRSILESNVFDNPRLLKVWIWCLCKASHKKHDQIVGRSVEHLKAGQFIYGRKKASEELKIPESTLNDYMKLLKTNGNIDIKSNNKYSVVTVANWAFYQGGASANRQQNRQQTDNKWTTNGHQMDTNKNVKNVKNVKNDYSSLNHRDDLSEVIRRKSKKVLEELNDESND